MSKQPSPLAKLRAALKGIESARNALEKEQKRLGKKASKKDRREIAQTLDKLDETEFSLLNAIERAQQVAREEKRERRREREEPAPPKPKKTRERTGVVIERDLLIRGFWDRYPASEQHGQYRSKFENVASELRRGPTAYDILERDFFSFTKSERNRLELRVSHGAIFETGEIIDARVVKKHGLDIRLSSDTKEALASLSAMLVRAGVLYTPEGWTSITKDTALPLGIQWVLLSKAEAFAARQYRVTDPNSPIADDYGDSGDDIDDMEQ